MKKKIFTFSIIFLFVCLIFIPIIYASSHKTGNILNPEDEGDHFPCGYELWFFHAFLTLEDGQKWDVASTFVYSMKRTKEGYTSDLSFCRIRHWNRQTGKLYDVFQLNEFPGPFHMEKNKVNISYYNNTLEGLFPDYHLYCEDQNNKTYSDLSFHATSMPYWIAQDITNGTLPWGISGTGKVYFIPQLEVTGTIVLNETTYNVTGFAYLEHDFGHMDFNEPFAFYSLKDAIDSTRLGFLLGRWWTSQIRQNKPNSTPSLHLSTDALFGWNWISVMFDNGWSMVIFRANIAGLSDGFVPSFTYFTKDGQEYFEVGCNYWNTKRTTYIEKTDIYLPTDFELTAYKVNTRFRLVFNCNTNWSELYSKDVAPQVRRSTCSFYYCGNVTGYYFEELENISLNGLFAIEQSRLLTDMKHRSLDIDILLPPDGLSLSIRKVSHRTGLERFLKIQLKPTFKFIFYIRPVFFN